MYGSWTSVLLRARQKQADVSTSVVCSLRTAYGWCWCWCCSWWLAARPLRWRPVHGSIDRPRAHHGDRPGGGLHSAYRALLPAPGKKPRISNHVNEKPLKNDRICLWQHWRGTFKPNAARGGEAESQDRNTVPCPVIGRGWCRLFSRIPPSWSRVVCQSSRQFSGTPPPIPAQVPIRVPSATRGAGSRGVQELENRAGSGRDRSVGGGWRNYEWSWPSHPTPSSASSSRCF